MCPTLYTSIICLSIIHLMHLNPVLTLYASCPRILKKKKIIVPGLKVAEGKITGLGFPYPL